MGLPPAEYADPSTFQAIAPCHDGTGKCIQADSIYVGANGTVTHKLPPRGLDVVDAPEEGQFSEGGSPLGVKKDNSKTSVDIPSPADLLDTPMTRIVHSSLFQNFTLFVIVLNGFWIGIDVEWNHPNLKKEDGSLPLEPTATVVENLFCVYFTFEIAVRILAFGLYNFTDKHLRGWFVFDSVLVTFMVAETWILVIVAALTGGSADGFLSKFSTLRLLRLTRLTRIMHSLPELLTLVRGMINAARAVGTVLLFMMLLMYVFAIVFTAQLGDPLAPENFEEDPYWVRDTDPTAQELFGSMGDSMMSLFTRGLLGDNLAETLQAIKDRAGPMPDNKCEDGECMREGGELWLMWVFILFMIISAFCLLNMLVGVLCEVIDETAKTESEAGQVAELHWNIANSFHVLDCSGDDMITKTEWATMRQDKEVQNSFQRMGVEDGRMDERLDQIEEHLFGRLDRNKMLDEADVWMPEAKATDTGLEEDEAIPLDKFVESILDIRPDAPASFLDLEILRTRAERDELVFNTKMDNMENILTHLQSVGPVGKLPGGNGFLEMGVIPMTPMGDLSMQKPSDVPEAVPLHLVDDKTAIERIKEEPNIGTSGSDAWIAGLSIEVLFAELKHRASLQPNSSLPAIEID